MSELMPCPFCGGEARCTTEATTQDIIGWCSVFCPNCSVSTPRQTSAEAIAAWNLRPAPSPSDAAFGKGIPTSLEVAWDDFAQRKGIAPHGVNAYAVEFARERCADLQAQFRAHMEQAPSREGWLTRKEVEDIIEGHVIGESDWRSLCDMALSALRPAETDKPCCEAECYGCGLKYSTHAHDTCPKCGSILRGETAHIETGKRRALRPAGDEGLRVAAEKWQRTAFDVLARVKNQPSYMSYVAVDADELRLICKAALSSAPQGWHLTERQREALLWAKRTASFKATFYDENGDQEQRDYCAETEDALRELLKLPAAPATKEGA